MLFLEGEIRLTRSHLPSKEPSPRPAVLIPYELREAVDLLSANAEVIWKAHLIVIGTALEICPANASQCEKNRNGRGGVCRGVENSLKVMEKTPREMV